MPGHATTATYSDVTNLATPEPKTANGLLWSHVVVWPNIEAQHTLFASLMDHEFPEGFKPVNIESYDGTTDPAVWIEDFLLHIHMARGDDLHAIKYLPLKLKGPARHWLNSLPENSIGSWEELEAAFCDNFQGTYVRP